MQACCQEAGSVATRRLLICAIHASERPLHSSGVTSSAVAESPLVAEQVADFAKRSPKIGLERISTLHPAFTARSVQRYPRCRV